jgi:NAD(P)-dependent dehydrogenase (short-subunit alcohol dehydrogenase family)
MKHLEGKVAIVTGGAGGMGQWISRTFAEQGAKVIVADTGGDVEGRGPMDPGRVNAVVDAIKAAGGMGQAVVGDIAEMDFAESLVKKAVDDYGKLDIVVAAHGILRERMLFNMQEDEWDGVIRVHLKGCFTITRFASLYWRQSMNGGRLIMFSSSAGVRGVGGQPNYSAAHAGKIGLTLSCANALARYNVTCNAISPGAATRMTDRGRAVAQGGGPGMQTSENAAGTRMDPRNVVPAIVYLASDKGANISGRVVGVTGHKITMWREPQWDASIYSETPKWDIDELFRVMPESLGAPGWPKPAQQFP